MYIYANRFFNSSAYVHADMRIARSVNGTYYIGTDGYVCSSTNNGTDWRVLSQGTAIREKYCLGTSQSNHYRTVCGSQDNGTSFKHKDVWVEFYGADGMEGIIHPLNDDWMISSVQYGGRRRTKDGGQTQGGVTPSGQSGSGNADWIAPPAYDPNDHMTIFHFSQEVYESTNFGDSWTLKGGPTTFTGNIKKAAVAENNSDIMVIARNGNIEKSTDRGATFASIKSNLPNHTITDIAFDPKNDDNIIVVYSRYQNDGEKVFLTTNGGTSWTNISYNINDMPIRSVVIDHSDSSWIYLGGEIGVYTKSMNGTSWSLYNTDLPNTAVTEMEINNGSNTLKAVTWGRGLWDFHCATSGEYWGYRGYAGEKCLQRKPSPLRLSIW